MRKELCRGTYNVEQVPGQVIVHATGVHPTTGYKVYFEPYKMPNAFALIHERPEGFVGEMVTPFAVSISYFARDKVKSVLVVDADGRHNVPVEQVPDTHLVAKGPGDSPGPFTLPSLDKEGSAAPELDARELVVRRAEGVGFSNTFSFQEALEGAISDAASKLPPSTVADQLIKVEVVSMGAEIGGIAGLHRLSIHVIASAT